MSPINLGAVGRVRDEAGASRLFAAVLNAVAFYRLWLYGMAASWDDFMGYMQVHGRVLRFVPSPKSAASFSVSEPTKLYFFLMIHGASRFP